MWRWWSCLSNKFGTFPAILLADLIAKELYFESKNQLDDMGGFFNASIDLEFDLNCSEKMLRKYKGILVEAGFIKLKKRGIPAKHYFYIQHDNIAKFLSTVEIDRTGTVEKVRARRYKKARAINKNKVIRIKE